MAIKRLFRGRPFYVVFSLSFPTLWYLESVSYNLKCKKKVVALAFLHLKPDMQKRADLAEETVLIFWS